MEFEFDAFKSDLNYKKHGVSFEDALVLWEDNDRIEISAKLLDEPRSLVIDRLKGKIWAAVVTYRNEKVRIISVRRARVNEVDLYES